jgi:ferredoxin-NADP reductase
MAYQFYDAVIVDIIQEAPLVRRFFIKMPESINFTFKAGQFVMLHLPIEDKTKYANRSYSIASAPSTDNIFELVIVLKPTGIGTPFEWVNFKIGTVIQVSQVLGKFIIREPIDTDLCYIATGTGIAPLRSQLLDIRNRNVPHKNIYLVFGNRVEQDILYREEMQNLEKELENFRFIPVLSRADANWKGERGYVHHVYETIFADHRPAKFYICGWKDMVKEARERLSVMGYDNKSVFFELFD